MYTLTNLNISSAAVTVSFSDGRNTTFTRLGIAVTGGSASLALNLRYFVGKTGQDAALVSNLTTVVGSGYNTGGIAARGLIISPSGSGAISIAISANNDMDDFR